MMKLNRFVSFFVIVVSLNNISAQEKIKTPSFISNNMVLQQNFDAPLWGWTESGTKIIIKPSWDNNVYQTSTDHNGNWFVKVKTPSAGGLYFIEINDDTLKNILIGEVWVCSGQSNMQWALQQSDNPEVEITNANYPNI
ncbi:MAG: hypothetical protein WAR79_01775 [Melioribacteraceae bacterium]